MEENARAPLDLPPPVPTWSKLRVPDGLAAQFAGFAIIGALNTIMTFLLYQLVLFVAPYWLAYSLSFIAGLAFSLVMNARVVFGRAITAGLAARYVGFYVASFLVGLGMVTGLIRWLGVPPRLAPIGAVAVLVFLNFLGTRIILGQRRCQDQTDH